MVKLYVDFIREEFGSEIKKDLASVIDIEKRKKDVDNISKKIEDANQNIIKKKEELSVELDKLEKLEISDYTEANKKLLSEKIKKYREDIAELQELIDKFKINLNQLKK